MQKFSFYFFLLFLFSCTTNNQNTSTKVATNQTSIFDETLIIEDAFNLGGHKVQKAPFEVTFDIKRAEKNDYNLIIQMNLEEGSYFVSPHSSDRFKGRFNVSIDENDYLELNDNFIENPRSKEEFDPHPFIDGLVNWVSVNTNYSYPFTVLKNKDFEVEGMLQFVIEPRCTLEKIKFVITSKNEKISIKQL